MLNVFTVVTTICLVAGGLWLLLRTRRRDVGFSGATVSRQWLVQHQGDDRS
jgi:hypothetical protein